MGQHQKLLGILAIGLAFAAGGRAHAAPPPGLIECLNQLEASNPSFTCCDEYVGAETFDCDGVPANGCECRPRDTCHAAKCAGTACALTQLADGTYCPAAPDACPGMGVCNAGVCGCPSGGIHGNADMAKAVGATDTGCNYASTSTTTGAGLAFGLLGLALVLAVRRRRQ